MDLYQFRTRAEQLRFVGVGGLVPIVKRSVSEAQDLIGAIGSQLFAAGARAHFFGIGSPVVLSSFAAYPWFSSADSQSWLCGFKALEMIRQDGSRMKTERFGLALTGEECAAQNIRQVHGLLTGHPLQLAMI